MSIKCDLTGKEANYYLGVARARVYKADKIVGAVCPEKVEEVINRLMNQAFGTEYWAVVLNLNKVVIYHSFDANQEKIAAGLGWRLKLEELESGK